MQESCITEEEYRESQNRAIFLIFTSGAIATAKSMGGKCLLRVIFEIKAVRAQTHIETNVIEVTDLNSVNIFDLRGCSGLRGCKKGP